MAEFLQPFEQMLLNEGGLFLHTVKSDRGGQTFGGIARNFWRSWEGWEIIDAGGTPPIEMLRTFYKANFWDVMRLDEVNNQNIARSLFDFGVNAGVKVSIKLAQVVVGATPDGVIGPKTVGLLNEADPDLFMARFTIAKLARYEQIITRDRSQQKFLLGWLRRSLKESL